MMQWLAGNAGLKVAALVLATMTWFFVKGITSDRRVIQDVLLEIKVKPGLALLRSDPATVSVVVSGTRDDVRQVSRQDVSAILDLSRDDRTGEWSVPLRTRMISAPRRVLVDEVLPARVKVNVDQIVERELRVEPQLTGTLPTGLAVERVTIDPLSVRVRGPKSVLESMSGIATIPIDVTGRRTSFRESVELAPVESITGESQRRWVQADVRITEGRSVDSAPGAGVQEKR
jgi:YbbR domain-containing protein